MTLKESILLILNQFRECKAKSGKLPLLILLTGLAVALATGVGLSQAQEPGPQGDVSIQAALGTAFTYQGRLVKSGTPMSDTCDFRFSLRDAQSGGSQVGSTLDKSGISVTDGYFTVQLDFGSGAFQGDARCTRQSQWRPPPFQM